MYKFRPICNMSEDMPTSRKCICSCRCRCHHMYLHEIGLQEAFTCRNVMTTHKTKIAGFGPAQCWSLNPECIAILCEASPCCAEHAAAIGHEHACMITVQLVRLHDVDRQRHGHAIDTIELATFGLVALTSSWSVPKGRCLPAAILADCCRKPFAKPLHKLQERSYTNPKGEPAGTQVMSLPCCCWAHCRFEYQYAAPWEW